MCTGGCIEWLLTKTPAAALSLHLEAARQASMILDNIKVSRKFEMVCAGERMVMVAPYSPKYSLSFMSHHAERISLTLSVVRGVNRAIRSHLATLSARLAPKQPPSVF